MIRCAESEAFCSFSSSVCAAVALLSSECHLRWKTDSLAAGPRLCSAHGGPVGIVSFMTGAHLSKTVRQSWVQGSRGGAGGTDVSHCPHFCSEGVLGAGVWSCFLHGDSTLPLLPLPRCCCQSHREVIWLIIPTTIEWGLCLPRVVSSHLRSHKCLEIL